MPDMNLQNFLMRDFDHSLFMHHPSEDLRIDMERLQDLNEKTKEEYERAEV